jgi:cytochrome c oxidase subunit I
MVASVVLVLMMIFGVIMLLNQGNVVRISPQMFYKVMTIHGTGMIGIAALGGSAIMWYYLSKYIQLNAKVFLANLILSLIDVVMILVAIFGFNFSDGWTFLFPLSSLLFKYIWENWCVIIPIWSVIIRCWIFANVLLFNC